MKEDVNKDNNEWSNFTRDVKGRMLERNEDQYKIIDALFQIEVDSMMNGEYDISGIPEEIYEISGPDFRNEIEEMTRGKGDRTRDDYIIAMWELYIKGHVGLVSHGDGFGIRIITSGTAKRAHVKRLALRFGLKVPQSAKLK